MPDWLEKVVAGGPAAILGLMWWLERQDRKAAYAKLETLSERTIVLLTELKGLLSGKRNGST
jgi:hypothetical protein